MGTRMTGNTCAGLLLAMSTACATASGPSSEGGGNAGGASSVAGTGATSSAGTGTATATGGVGTVGTGGATGGSTHSGGSAPTGGASNTGGNPSGGNVGSETGGAPAVGGSSGNDIPVYTDAVNITSLAWKGNGTFNELTSGGYEGTKAYEYNYKVSNYWDGFYLNLTHPIDVSHAVTLKYAYKGLPSPAFEFVRLHSSGGACAAHCDIENHNPATSWQVVTIPMSQIAGGAAQDGVDLTKITAIEFGFSGSGNASGTFDLDDIVFGG